MGEYEPNDSRRITQTNSTVPGEPPRTGPREHKTRFENEEKAAKNAAELSESEQEAPQVRGSAGGGSPDQSQGQSQGQQGQSQSMGGMSQSQQGPSASHRSDARPEQLGEAQPSQSAPTQGDTGSSGGASGAAWAPDFPPGTAGQPQNMSEQDPQGEAERRRQATEQAGHEPTPKGFGYGADGGEEMEEAPDASERGYGGAGQQRIDKLERDR